MAALLTLNIRLIGGISIIFVQLFGAFFGSLLTRTMLSGVAFMDAFISLGIEKQAIKSNQQTLIDTKQFLNLNNEIFSNRFQVFFL